eukprot:3425900-Pyramimonas_sp.AAC.1
MPCGAAASLLSSTRYGHRLGDSRFYDAMRGGCIPVVFDKVRTQPRRQPLLRWHTYVVLTSYLRRLVHYAYAQVFRVSFHLRRSLVWTPRGQNEVLVVGARRDTILH